MPAHLLAGAELQHSSVYMLAADPLHRTHSTVMQMQLRALQMNGRPGQHMHRVKLQQAPRARKWPHAAMQPSRTRSGMPELFTTHNARTTVVCWYWQLGLMKTAGPCSMHPALTQPLLLVKSNMTSNQATLKHTVVCKPQHACMPQVQHAEADTHTPPHCSADTLLPCQRAHYQQINKSQRSTCRNSLQDCNTQ